MGLLRDPLKCMNDIALYCALTAAQKMQLVHMASICIQGLGCNEHVEGRIIGLISLGPFERLD